MAQFARPDSNVTNTGTGGFADLDESSPSDADYWFGDNNTVAEIEVGLSDISAPDAGTCTVRWRIAKTNAGTVDGSGNALTMTARLLQGTTQIATSAAETPTGTWTSYSFTFDPTSVSDWTDLRVEVTTTGSGGSPANRRGGAVSWVEVETPDAQPPTTTVIAPAADATASATAPEIILAAEAPAASSTSESSAPVPELRVTSPESNADAIHPAPVIDVEEPPVGASVSVTIYRP